MNHEIIVSAYGEKGILLHWPNKIEEAISHEVIAARKLFTNKYKHLLLDISNGYQSLLLYFMTTVTQSLLQEVKLVVRKANFKSTKIDYKTWKIPVCYNLAFGTDIHDLLNFKGLSLSKMIHLHTQPTYHVYCKGFLPGFLYLGGLNKKLHTNRKDVPNLKIPKNSVAIGGQQTGVYPSESPGGWHIIGRTPFSFFDVNRSPPSIINVGDKVNFFEISLSEFYLMERSNSVVTNEF